MIYTILVGAGRGKRLSLSLPKAFLEIGNKKLFFYSIEKFYKFSDKIFIALPRKYLKTGEELIKEKFPEVKVVKGGKERQDSVLNCLKFIEDSGIVLIHDVARPFVSEELIKRVIYGTKKYGACIPCLKITDTLKEIKNNFVKKTIDREKIFSIQTPQGFKTELIKKAYKFAIKNKIKGKDDSFFVEKIGYNKIYCVEGERENIKITYPEDLILAEFILCVFQHK